VPERLLERHRIHAFVNVVFLVARVSDLQAVFSDEIVDQPSFP